MSDPFPFKVTVRCPKCERSVKIEGVMSMAVALTARQIQRLGCYECRA